MILKRYSFVWLVVGSRPSISERSEITDEIVDASCIASDNERERHCVASDNERAALSTLVLNDVVLRNRSSVHIIIQASSFVILASVALEKSKKQTCHDCR